jgi:Ca2+-binding RTX toxin-like protein
LGNVHGPIAENASTAVHTKIANIAVTDVDGGANNLSLSGLDAGLFEIVGATLWLKAGAHLDFEANPVLDVTVNVNDSTVGGPVDAQASLSIAIGDVLETVNGTASANTLSGANQGEITNGLAGNDRIMGNGGNDRIIGGLGADVLTGGAGADVFVFNSIGESAPGQSGAVNNGSFSALQGQGLRDIITDFAHGLDKIDLSAIDANTRVAGNQAFTWRGTANFTAAPGQLIERLYNPAGTANDKTIIYGDINGDARADFQIELTGLKTLTVSDFIL